MKTSLEMAREVYGEHTVWFETQLQRLEQLIELVRADEREKWMERTAILIRGEREACAKVCEDLVFREEETDKWTITREKASFDCAAAIRARP